MELNQLVVQPIPLDMSAKEVKSELRRIVGADVPFEYEHRTSA